MTMEREIEIIWVRSIGGEINSVATYYWGVCYVCSFLAKPFLSLREKAAVEKRLRLF
jgi:hypothetical protein